MIDEQPRTQCNLSPPKLSDLAYDGFRDGRNMGKRFDAKATASKPRAPQPAPYPPVQERSKDDDENSYYSYYSEVEELVEDNREERVQGKAKEHAKAKAVERIQGAVEVEYEYYSEDEDASDTEAAVEYEYYTATTRTKLQPATARAARE